MSEFAKSRRNIIKPTYKWNENFLEFFNSLITDLHSMLSSIDEGTQVEQLKETQTI